MRVGIDIDDVLADLNASVNRYLHEVHGIKVTREQWTVPTLQDIVGWEKAQAIEMMKDFDKSPYLEGLAPIPGAIEGITAIRNHHELILITARREEIDRQTRSFLHEHFGDVFDGLHYTNGARHDDTGISKAVVCKREKIEVLIEDGPRNVRECVEAGIPIMLFDTPWNQMVEPHPLITRVHSWQEIVQKLVK